VIDALALYRIAQVPTISLLQARCEIARLQLQHSLSLVGHHRDRRHIEVISEVKLWTHRMTTGHGNLPAWNADDLRLLARGSSQSMNDLFLRERARVGNFECVASGLRMLENFLAGQNHIRHRDELHQTASIARQNRRPS